MKLARVLCSWLLSYRLWQAERAVRAYREIEPGNLDMKWKATKRLERCSENLNDAIGWSDRIIAAEAQRKEPNHGQANIE